MRDDQLPGTERLRIAEGDGAQFRGADLEHGDVGIGILADQVGALLAAVRKDNLDLRGVLDHVAVGEDQAVGGKDEARAAARLRRGPSARPGATLVHVHRHHGRRHELDRIDDGPGIGVEQIIVRGQREGVRHGPAGMTSDPA